ncbi:hypothetical protein LCGC14_1476780, partial [marine sediment metagenome]
MLPLDGLKVVAIEQAVAAPFASSRLADAGAQVTKIERPEGDFARGYDAVARGQSSYFVWLNRGKDSVTLDLGSDAGEARLAELLGQADVLIQNLKPGALARLGFDPDRLARDYPRLITCSISGFGETGPMADAKAYDLLIQAESGLCSITGGPNEPARVGVSVVDALSDWLELRIWRDGKEHIARFERGDTVRHLEVVGDAEGRKGTEVRFLASTDTFSDLDYSFKTLENRLRELAFLNSGVRIILTDDRHSEQQRSEMFYEGGVREFVKYIDRHKHPMIPDPIYITGEKDGITVEVAMWWNDSYNEMVLPFTNNI